MDTEKKKRELEEKPENELKKPKVSLDSIKDIKSYSQDLQSPKVGIQLQKKINHDNIFEKIEDSKITTPIVQNSITKLHWETKPKNILVSKKHGDQEADIYFMKVVSFLKEKKINVFVDPFVVKNEKLTDVETWKEENSKELYNIIDLVIVLGGDGTILHTAAQFSEACPPVLSFNMGSLGFLTSSFEISSYKETIEQVLAGDVFITVRNRMSAVVTKSGKKESLKFQVLNDIVIDRSLSPFLTSLECYVDNNYITLVQADGIIISTPTGSTAYSMSAGGSMVHPNVGGLLLTPICPHSLSFRPIVLPDSIELKIKNSENARGSAWISFDGKNRLELGLGDEVEIKTSKWPLPAISKTDQTSEWFLSLAKCLHWNTRDQQKPMVSKHSSQRMIL